MALSPNQGARTARRCQGGYLHALARAEDCTASTSAFGFSSKRPQELHQILFLRRRQIRAQDEVEEFDRVLQSQEPAVMQIRRRILHAAQREGLDRTVSGGE